MIGQEATETAVTLSGVTFSYPHAPALAGIDLTVPAGSYFGIVGPNGSGKTTLAYLIAGILKPDTGTLDTHGLRVCSQIGDCADGFRNDHEAIGVTQRYLLQVSQKQRPENDSRQVIVGKGRMAAIGGDQDLPG